jgi:hypothetical protein
MYEVNEAHAFLSYEVGPTEHGPWVMTYKPAENEHNVTFMMVM